MSLKNRSNRQLRRRRKRSFHKLAKFREAAAKKLMTGTTGPGKIILPKGIVAELEAIEAELEERRTHQP